MNLIGRESALLATTRGLASRVAAAAFVVGVGVPRVALAQVQDDAALADVRDDKPPPGQSGAPSTTTPSNTGFDDRPETPTDPREVDLDPPMTSAELRRAHPDLQVRSTPPPALTVSLTSIYPFQPLGLGLGYEVYALPRLRLSTVLSTGVSAVVNNRWRISFYGDIGIGVVVLRSPTEVVTEIKALPTLAGRNFHSTRSAWGRLWLGEEQPPPGSFVRAILPAFHSLELEGGLFSGLYPLYRCTAHCAEDPNVAPHTNEDASLQVTAVYAGLRYVYFRWARSEQVPFVSRFGVEAAVDAITNPFWPSDPKLFNLSDHHPAEHPVGVRVKLRIIGAKCGPNGGCVGFDLMGGYLPTPADALVSANVVYQ
jgi:hypothetical protein